MTGWLSRLFGADGGRTGGAGGTGGGAVGATRADMDEALQRRVVPRLREMGFTGSRPNFRRRRGGSWDLLAFQFSQYGGRFVVELARWPDAEIHRAGRMVGPKAATPHRADRRHRLGSTGDDHWFDFEALGPEAAADEVLALLDDAEEWRKVDALEVTRSDL